MSKVKTKIDSKDVEQFLINKWSPDITNLSTIKGGEISQAFSFEDSLGDYVIKVRKVREIHKMRKPFHKEFLAHQYITSKDMSIPIPKVLKYGTFLEDDSARYIYCICEKHEGSFVHMFPKNEQETVDKSLVNMLHRIHCIDLSETNRYGNWTNFKEAASNSWKEYFSHELQRCQLFLQEAIDEGKYETEFIAEAIKKLKPLQKFCIEKKYLVHSDYGFDNVLANSEGEITAVFDWEHSLIGDFVYDIAWLDHWEEKETTYAELYKDSIDAKCILDYTNYSKRLQFYKLYHGITAALFFIDSDQKEEFQRTKSRLETIF